MSWSDDILPTLNNILFSVGDRGARGNLCGLLAGPAGLWLLGCPAGAWVAGAGGVLGGWREWSLRPSLRDGGTTAWAGPPGRARRRSGGGHSDTGCVAVWPLAFGRAQRGAELFERGQRGAQSFCEFVFYGGQRFDRGRRVL